MRDELTTFLTVAGPRLAKARRSKDLKALVQDKELVAGQRRPTMLGR